MTKPIIDLSKTFSQLLREALSDHEMATVVSRNETDEYAGCCASHDFCDANEVMNDAFIQLFDRSCILPSEVEQNPELEAHERKDVYLWNEAWQLAKNNKFYL